MQMHEKIRELRKSKNLSQKELAKMCGVSVLAYQHWEYGKFEPLLINAITLADIFDVSLDELCCRDFKGGN